MTSIPFSHRTLFLLVSGCLSVAAAHTACAQVDDIQLKLLRQLELPMRWDNVEENTLYWYGGEPPSRHYRLPLHIVQLSPGKRIAIRVPAGERVRVVGLDLTLSDTDLIMRFSQGSGASVRQIPVRSDDGLSLLVEGHTSRSGILYIDRPDSADSQIGFAVFVSRHIPYPTIAPYRKVHALSAPTHSMRRSNEGGAQTYWQLDLGHPLEVELHGPARFALQGRFVYPISDTTRLQGWWVRLGTSDGVLAELQYETTMDSAQPVIIDDRESAATRQKETWFEVPEGSHTFRLEANGPFLARILEQENPDYLIPTLNEPEFTARDARREEPSLILKMATWRQAPAEITAALSPEAPPAETRQAGLRLVQDNRRRDGSMIAASALQAAALRRRDDPSIQNEANEFLELHTFYRDLLPEAQLTSSAPHYAWYLTPKLLAIGEKGRGAIATQQHERNMLDGMDAGIFVALPTKMNSPLAAPNHNLIVHFDNDSFDLNESEQTRLNQLAAAVHWSGSTLEIIGHADSRASDSYNLALSRRRAETVASYLARQGVSPNQLRYSARGFRLPVAENSTESGRANNRRVTIIASSPVEIEQPNTLLYRLPELSAPTLLHIAMHSDAAARHEKFYLQFDDRDPIEISVEQTPEVSADLFAPSSGEIALLLQRWRHDEFGGSTLSAAFSRTQTPALLIPAGISEVMVPRKIKRVRAWRASPEVPEGRVWLAMKLRVAKPYALSESGLLAALETSTGAFNGVSSLKTAADRSPPTSAELPIRDLDSHLQPLARLIRTEHLSLLHTIAMPSRPNDAGKDAAPLIEAALRLERSENWLPALEKWGAAANLGNSEKQSVITFGRVRVLFSLGEPFLAEQLLKQELLHGINPDGRKQASDELVRFYQRTGDQEALVTIACTAFMRDPDEETLLRLAISLQDNGMPDFALSASMLLPAERRPKETLLRAALMTDRWQIFNRVVESLPSEADRLFWTGLKQAMVGKFSEAQHLLSGASLAGHAAAGEYFAHLHLGLAIDHSLRAVDRPSDELLSDWGNWAANAPGHREWKELPPMIQDFAGAASLYSIDRDAFFSMYRAETKRPLRLGFFGPAQLRLEARPEHRNGSAELLEGWLRVRETTAGSEPRLWAFPITQNPPASGLSIVGNESRIPGRKITADVAFGTGWHEIEVDGTNLPLLVRSFLSLAEFRFPVLPLLTAETARRPEDVQLPEVASDFLGCFRCSVLVPESASEPIARFHLERKLLDSNPATLANTAQTRAAYRKESATDDFATVLAGQDPAQILNFPIPQDPEGLLHYMSGLLWLAEQSPEHYERILSTASSIVDKHPDTPALQSIIDRLSRDSGWVPLSNVQASAGVRARRVELFEPENPALRIRQALLPPLRANEYLLTGSNRLLLNLFNPTPAQFVIRLAAEDVSGLLPVDLHARWQIDNRKPNDVSLIPGAELRIQPFMLGKGEHTVRFWIESPLAGQFMRIHLDEPQRAGQSRPVVDFSERFYQVATHHEPVRVNLPGPMWLRIDKWVNERTETSYRLLRDEWNEVELRPSADNSEDLYRLFFKGVVPDQAITPQRIVQLIPEPVPPPLKTLADRPNTVGIALRDGLPLGGQEDGTWSIFSGWQQRLFKSPENAVPNGPTGLERFIEGGASWRYHDADRNIWYQSEFLGRSRNVGGPTFGVRSAVLHTPLWSSWNFGAEGNLFLQVPGGEDSGSMEYSYTMRGFIQQRRDLGPKSYHLPEIAGFAKHTSLRPGDSPIAYQQGRIDQDVFTPYSARHGFGMEISDTLVVQPWLDTLLLASARLTSNPDLNIFQPDRLAASVAWKQLLGPTWLQLRLAENRYFLDGDRQQSKSTRHMAFDLGGDIWGSQQHRFEFGLKVARDLTEKSNYGGIVFTWHMGNGRAFKDFRASEIDFRDLRSRRIPQEDNNGVTVFSGNDNKP